MLMPAQGVLCWGVQSCSAIGTIPYVSRLLATIRSVEYQISMEGSASKDTQVSSR